MKKLFLILLCVLTVMPSKATYFFDPGGSAGSILPLADLRIERFEGTGTPGYDNNSVWTESGEGTIDENYSSPSTNVLGGAQSLRLAASSQTVNTVCTFTAGTNRFGFFKFKSLSTAVNYRFFQVLDGSGNTIGQCIFNSSRGLDIRNGSTGGTSTTLNTTNFTTVYIMWEYRKGTGLNGFMSVEWSMTPSFLGSQGGTNQRYAQHTGGNATADAARFRIGANNNTGYDFVVDDIGIASTLDNLHPASINRPQDWMIARVERDGGIPVYLSRPPPVSPLASWTP